jgi:hypothetical protein
MEQGIGQSFVLVVKSNLFVSLPLPPSSFKATIAKGLIEHRNHACK